MIQWYIVIRVKKTELQFILTEECGHVKKEVWGLGGRPLG